MFKPSVAIASLLAGSAAASAAVYVQVNDTAFTSAPETAVWTPNPYARSYDLQPIYVEVDVPVGSASAEDEPVFLLTRASKRAAKRPTGLGVCSAWRDVGVKAVTGRAGAETRHVRDLCQ